MTDSGEPLGEATLPLVPPAAALLVADDEARFQEVNEAATSLLGYSESELKQMHVWDITPAVQRSMAQAMWSEFLVQGRQAGVYQVRRADGRSITVQYEATANFRPGQHLSILQPASPSHAESRPLDECPFHRPFPADFDRCPTYEPVLSDMADSHEQSVGQVWTCLHLGARRLPARAVYYGRCGLGDAVHRSQWLAVASQHGLREVRALRLEFYRAAQREIARLVSAQAAASSKRQAFADTEAVKQASDGIMAIFADFVRRRGRELEAAKIDPGALRRALERTLADARTHSESAGLRPSQEIIASYSLEVQAFLRPDLVASRLLGGSATPVDR